MQDNNINRLNCLVSLANSSLLTPKQVDELRQLIDKEIRELKKEQPHKGSWLWGGGWFW